MNCFRKIFLECFDVCNVLFVEVVVFCFDWILKGIFINCYYLILKFKLFNLRIVGWLLLIGCMYIFMYLCMCVCIDIEEIIYKIGNLKKFFVFVKMFWLVIF